MRGEVVCNAIKTFIIEECNTSNEILLMMGNVFLVDRSHRVLPNFCLRCLALDVDSEVGRWEEEQRIECSP